MVGLRFFLIGLFFCNVVFAQKDNNYKQQLREEFQLNYEKGNWVEAISSYDRLKSLTNSLTIDETYNLGNAYLKKKEYQKAINQYEEVLQKDPSLKKATTKSAINNLSIALRLKKKSEKSKKEQEQVKQKLEELKNDQQELSKSNESSELQSKEQDSIRKKFEELKGDLSDNKNSNGDNSSKDSEKKQQLTQEIEEHLNNASDRLKERDQNGAKKHQESAVKSMDELIKYLEDENGDSNNNDLKEIQTNEEKKEMQQQQKERILQNISDKETKARMKFKGSNSKNKTNTNPW